MNYPTVEMVLAFKKPTQEEIDSIKIRGKDHHHFTNDCCLCNKSKEDADMVAIQIDRRSGFENKPYVEMDYACKECLKKAGKL